MTIRYSIECWISTPDDKVLLLQVPARPGKHDAFWQPVTGGIEEDETPLVAALREVHEETGLELDKSCLTEITTGFVVPISPELSISKTLFSAITNSMKVVTNIDEHQDHRWFSFGQVSGALFWESNWDTWQLILQHRENVDKLAP